MALPVEIDFEKDPVASVERMNRAFEFIWILVKGVAALKPDYDAAIAELQGIGLERINIVLQPVFARAAEILAALESHYDQFGFVPADRAGDTFTGPVTVPGLVTPAISAEALLAIVIAGSERLRLDASAAAFTGTMTLNGSRLRPAAKSDAEAWFRNHG